MFRSLFGMDGKCRVVTKSWTLVLSNLAHRECGVSPGCGCASCGRKREVKSGILAVKQAGDGDGDNANTSAAPRYRVHSLSFVYKYGVMCGKPEHDKRVDVQIC